MNRYADRLMSRRRDGRNPYGSKGGYVRDSAGRNYKNEIVRSPHEMEMMNYRMRDRARSGGRNDYRDMRRNDYANNRNNADYNDYNDYGYGYGVGMFDYDTEDYDDEPKKLTSKDIKKWEKELVNADGTMGAKFDVSRIKQLAQQQDVHFEEYSPETMTMVANMLYSDYCKILGGDAMLYIKLAKAFLEDDDFDGEPEEKAMLYYKCIVEKDD